MRKELMLIILIVMPWTTTEPRPRDIILWDIHDVILKRAKVFSELWHYEHKKELWVQSRLDLFKELIPLLVNNIYSEGSAQKYIALANKYDNPYLAELILRLSNAQEPISGTVEIMKELHSLGYQQHIGSNIYSMAFDQLTNPKLYPQLQEIFKVIDIKKSKVVDERDIRKPNPEFYHEYLQQNRIDLNKTRVIFIDDKKKNVDTARELGFTAILFQNPAQLRNALQELGIPLTPLFPTAPSHALQVRQLPHFGVPSRAFSRLPMSLYPVGSDNY